jgi:hypothetical protein
MKNEYRQAGYFTVQINAMNLASGVYFYRIIATNNSEVKNFIETKRMVVIK